VREKYTYWFQRVRVIRFALDVAPDKEVTFDEAITGIKFRIGDGPESQEFDPVSALADRSDAWLRDLIKQLAEADPAPPRPGSTAGAGAHREKTNEKSA